MIFPTSSDIWSLHLDIFSHDPDYHPGHALESLYNGRWESQDPELWSYSLSSYCQLGLETVYSKEGEEHEMMMPDPNKSEPKGDVI